MDEAFHTQMLEGYAPGPPSIVLGSPMLEGAVLSDARVALPLATVNRHGLVAGATGTGKTKTPQVLAGQLSDAGVPVFVADVKGDLTGLAQPIDASDPRVAERCASLSVVLRAILTLEEDGAGAFFGEPEFEVADLMRAAEDGRGVISLLELSDVMDRPRLFSTFML